MNPRLFDLPAEPESAEPVRDPVRDPALVAIVDALPAPDGWPLGNMMPGYRIAYRQRGREMLLIQALPERRDLRITATGTGFHVVVELDPGMLDSVLPNVLAMFGGAA